MPRKLFEKGNPGKPKGAVSQRKRLTQIIEEVCGEPEVQAAFTAAVREIMLTNPLGGFTELVKPFVPKSVELGGSVGLEGLHDLVRELARKVHGADSGADREGGK